MVRFADTLGLDLAAVKTIMQEDLPLIPDSAFSHLNLPKELLSDIRDHISAAAANSNNNSSPKASPISSPSSKHRIFNTGNCAASGAKPFLPKYPLPLHVAAGDGYQPHHYVNGLAGSLDRLHLDFDDDLLDDCIPVKSPSPLPCVGALPSILSKKAPVVTEQEVMSKSMPPWLGLYQSTHTATLIPEFIEPFVQMNFQDRVKSASVCLENCYVSNTVSGSGAGAAAAALAVASSLISSASPPPASVAGAGSSPSDGVISVTTCIRVVNRSFEKEIYVRFTTNDWATWCEEKANFIPTSTDSWSDRFTATFFVAHLNAGQRVKFALRYQTGGQEFWDNNNGQDYSLMYRI
jgi:hypothetical protein